MQYDPNENAGFAASGGGASGGGMDAGAGSTSGASTSGAGASGTAGDFGREREGLTQREGTTSGSGRESFGKQREKASQIKATLADKLEQGAQKLRERTHGRTGDGLGSTDAASGMGDGPSSHSTTGDRTIERASESLAHGMESTANWVRNADLQKVKGDVEHQVRANPGRALLVAVGVGYLLGKILRGGGNRA